MTEQKPQKKHGGGIAWLFILGYMMYPITRPGYQPMAGAFDMPIMLGTAIGACYFYYWLKKKSNSREKNLMVNILIGIATVVLFIIIRTSLLLGVIAALHPAAT